MCKYILLVLHLSIVHYAIFLLAFFINITTLRILPIVAYKRILVYKKYRCFPLLADKVY